MAQAETPSFFGGAAFTTGSAWPPTAAGQPPAGPGLASEPPPASPYADAAAALALELDHARDSAWRNGLKAGQEEGHETGFQEGNHASWDLGYQRGFEEGLQRGHWAGWAACHEASLAQLAALAARPAP